MFTLHSLLLTSGCVAMTTHVRPVFARTSARAFFFFCMRRRSIICDGKTFHTRVSKDAGEESRSRRQVLVPRN